MKTYLLVHGVPDPSAHPGAVHEQVGLHAVLLSFVVSSRIETRAAVRAARPAFLLSVPAIRFG
jgi:hypothetical protein